MNVTSNRKRSLTLAALAMLASGTLAAAPAHAAALDDHGKSNDGRSSSRRGQAGRSGCRAVGFHEGDRLEGPRRSVFSIPVDGSTRFYVGDTPASLGDIKPGFIVTGKWKDGAAEEVRAFNPSPVPTVSTVSTVSTVASVKATGSSSPHLTGHPRRSG